MAPNRKTGSRPLGVIGQRQPGIVILDLFGRSIVQPVSDFIASLGSGDVTGPGSSTDNALVRFDGTTGKLLQNSLITLTDAGILQFPDDVRQTFNPGGTNAGVNVGAHTADPSSLSNGDLWYQSTANKLRARVNGSTLDLGTGSGDVVGPAAATDNGIARYDSATGKLLQDTSGPTVEDDGTIANLTDPVNAQDAATKAYVDASVVVGGSGVVVQVVNTQTGAVATGTTTIPLDDTIPQNTEGDQYMSLAITPTNAANKLRIDVVFFGTVNGASWSIVALFQDSTAGALATFANYQTIGTGGMPVVFTHYMTAGTTSPTTFKVRAGRDGSAGTTMTFNGQSGGRLFGGVFASSITITEIVP